MGLEPESHLGSVKQPWEALLVGDDRGAVRDCRHFLGGTTVRCRRLPGGLQGGWELFRTKHQVPRLSFLLLYHFCTLSVYTSVDSSHFKDISRFTTKWGTLEHYKLYRWGKLQVYNIIFPIIWQRRKHIMVLDTFLLTFTFGQHWKSRTLDFYFLCFWYWSSDLASISIPWKAHGLLEHTLEILSVSQSWVLIICISNKSSSAVLLIWLSQNENHCLWPNFFTRPSGLSIKRTVCEHLSLLETSNAILCG